MKIYKKLLEIQKKVNVKKSKFNKFGNFHYRSTEDILTGVKPLLQKEQVLMIINDEIININDRFYIKATVTLYCDDEKLTTSAMSRESIKNDRMSESQTTASTSSFARKLALSAMFLIDDGIDDDTLNNRENYSNPTSETFNIKILEDLITQTGTAKSKLLEFYKLPSLDAIATKAVYDNILLVLRNKVKK